MKNLVYLLTLSLLSLSSCGGTTNNNTPTTPSNPIEDPMNTQISRFDIRFNTSTFDGWDNIQTACSETGNILPIYINGHHSSLREAHLNGKKLYKDSLLSESMKSSNKWFKSEDNVFAISEDGYILQFSSCPL